MRTRHQIDTVIRDVQRLLDAHRRSTGIGLQVPPDGYVEDDPYLSVLVTPTDAGLRASEYVESLGDVERQLRTSGVPNVLLVPALVD